MADREVRWAICRGTDRALYSSAVITIAQVIAQRFDIEALLLMGGVIVIVLMVTSSRRPCRRCPKCREVNREVAIFCAQCGQRLPGR